MISSQTDLTDAIVNSETSEQFSLLVNFVKIYSTSYTAYIYYGKD